MLWQHANAVELLFRRDVDSNGGEAVVRGVRVRTLTGIEQVVRALRFVFCMGTIESSRFFLQPSALGVPWNQSGLLGRHFQDHIDANVATVVPLDRAWPLDQPPPNGGAFLSLTPARHGTDGFFTAVLERLA